MRPSLTAPARFAPAMPAHALIAAALALPLAACNSAPSVTAENATPAEVAQKVQAATAPGGGIGDVTVQPGRWEGAMTIHDMDMPGLPPQAKEQMKAQMGQARSFVSCITEEDVKKQKAFFTGEQQDSACKYDRFTLGGGKIDAALSCERGRSGKMAMTMTGSYSPVSYHMDMDSRSVDTGPMAGMTMKMSVDARRTGDCRGTPDEK